MPTDSVSPFLPTLHTENTNTLLVPMSCIVLNISYKWNL